MAFNQTSKRRRQPRDPVVPMLHPGWTQYWNNIGPAIVTKNFVADIFNRNSNSGFCITHILSHMGGTLSKTFVKEKGKYFIAKGIICNVE